MTFNIGFLLFPNITQLDMTGPYEVFTRLSDAKVHLVWKSREPVTADSARHDHAREPKTRSAPHRIGA